MKFFIRGELKQKNNHYVYNLCRLTKLELANVLTALWSESSGFEFAGKCKHRGEFAQKWKIDKTVLLKTTSMYCDMR